MGISVGRLDIDPDNLGCRDGEKLLRNLRPITPLTLPKLALKMTAEHTMCRFRQQLMSADGVLGAGVIA
jgi:predicted ThiF/HesA family dinucleotide-utilizing enzyme